MQQLSRFQRRAQSLLAMPGVEAIEGRNMASHLLHMPSFPAQPSPMGAGEAGNQAGDITIGRMSRVEREAVVPMDLRRADPPVGVIVATYGGPTGPAAGARVATASGASTPLAALARNEISLTPMAPTPRGAAAGAAATPGGGVGVPDTPDRTAGAAAMSARAGATAPTPPRSQIASDVPSLPDASGWTLRPGSDGVAAATATSGPEGSASAAAMDEEEDPFYVSIGAVRSGAETKQNEATSPGRFVVSRAARWWYEGGPVPLTVNYTVKGTATQGTDYESIGGSVTIPAGQDSVEIVVNVKDDPLIEGTETVVVELQEGSEYDVVGGGTSTINIGDNDYVEIVIQTFIPEATVSAVGVGTFAGDNRRYFDTTPEVADNDYRTRVAIVVPRDAFQDPTYSQDAGVTKKLNEDGQVIQSGEASAANGNLGNHLGTTYDPATTTLGLRVQGFGRDPLVGFAPALDYVFNFDIRADVVTFKGGTHDAFPAFEIFVKDKGKTELTLVYGFMPGTGWWEPYYLGTPMTEIQPTGPGVNVPR